MSATTQHYSISDPGSKSPLVVSYNPIFFYAGGYQFKAYRLHNTYFVRDLTARITHMAYSPASLDRLLDQIERIGRRMDAAWRMSMVLYVFNQRRPIPQLQAVHGRRTQTVSIEPLTTTDFAQLIEWATCPKCDTAHPTSEACAPAAAPKTGSASIADIAFCEACGNDIPDGRLCPTCTRQSALDMQPVVVKTSKSFNAPIPGLSSARTAGGAATQTAGERRARNARTGNEQLVTKMQKSEAEMMARYPQARTLSEAHQLAMHDFLASKRVPAAALKTAGTR
jgi:hypothetical protein